MLNYYDEMYKDIKEALKYDYVEVLKEALDKEDAYKKLEEIFFMADRITGNASGSYYFSTYKSRKHCYEFSQDVKEALNGFGYSELLKKFELFERCVNAGYVDIETMEIDTEYEYYQMVEAWEEINDLNFETLDVITRCYLLGEVLTDVLDEMYK